jgi:rare lipoprotein A
MAVSSGQTNTPLTATHQTGTASWYGEAHRGKIMANGESFDPDKLTAASWSYPLGTKLRVSLEGAGATKRSVTVTVSDRGPAKSLVRLGRIIDLSRAAFQSLADPDKGLVRVKTFPLSDCGQRQP